MLWLYRLQQRAALTGLECAALLAVAATILVGLGVRQFQARTAPEAAALFAAEARAADSTFAALDRAAEAGAPTPPPAPARLAAVVAAADSAVAGPEDPASAPAADEPAPARAAGGDAPVAMNLNTADAATLERLPGIGPALAQRILDHRRTRGPFRRVDDLVDVRGIGPKTLEKMRPYLHL